jgi:hypothetical protein
MTVDLSDTPLLFIGGERLIQNQDLLQLLTANLGVSIIERSLPLGEDLILDTHCFVMTVSCSLLSTKPMPNNQVDQIFQRLLKLSLRYAKGWLIIENYTQDR